MSFGGRLSILASIQETVSSFAGFVRKLPVSGSNSHQWASKGEFARHWLFWQEAVGLFNSENPSGHVVDSPMNTRILVTAISVSAVVAIKRFAVGLWFGRQTFHNFGNDLARVMNQILLVSSFEPASMCPCLGSHRLLFLPQVSEVAGLAKYIEKTAGDENKSFMGIPSE